MSMRLRGWVAILAVGGVLAVAEPAYAGPTAETFHPVRIEESSNSDTTTDKQAVAHCPDGTVVHATGGKVTGGEGGVAMTGMIPSAALDTVTVTAKARTGKSGPWFVTAVAICAEPVTHPALISVNGLRTATAVCDSGVAYGTGFRFIGDVDRIFLHEVVPEIDLSQVRVDTRGTGVLGIPALVTAYAICADPPDSYQRLSATTTYDSTSPKAISSSPPCLVEYDCFIFGAGGLIEGSDRAFLDRLIQKESGGATSARGILAAPTVASLTGTDDEYSTTVYAIIGSWYLV